ncbi:hypothetical protein [Georgenia sp. SUBG003]|uniref:hypothetical protein n=1 Tax=Georgenia sp. SUBG003 TaxID=1497974 RepID=UPI0004D705F5|nr:hypothetical protein DA06_03445 [Georgenia sp. SUBG003]
MNPYVGDPNEMLGRIRHEDLLARAEQARRLRELRHRDLPTRRRPAVRLLQRVRSLAARPSHERRHAARLARRAG